MSNPQEPKNANKKVLTPIEQLKEKNILLEREVQAAKSLLWAAIKTQGGRVDIPDETMRSIDDLCQIASRYDSKCMVTIIESKRGLIVPPK